MIYNWMYIIYVCGFYITKAHDVGLNTSTKAGLWFEDKRTVFINESLIWFQSNSEGDIIDKLHWAMDNQIEGIIINPGAFTHYSYAIRDAISSIEIPTIEVHLSNIYSREEFRHKSFLSDRALGMVCGFGPTSYHLALQGMVSYLKRV